MDMAIPAACAPGNGLRASIQKSDCAALTEIENRFV